jgi:hypothetical protein
VSRASVRLAHFWDQVKATYHLRTLGFAVRLGDDEST